MIIATVQLDSYPGELDGETTLTSGLSDLDQSNIRRAIRVSLEELGAKIAVVDIEDDEDMWG